MQQAGFLVGGEPLTALDLVDTVILTVDPPLDLIGEPEKAAAWWGFEEPRLPAGPRPEIGATRRLRAAIRDLLDAQIEDRAPSADAVADVNAFAAAVPTSRQLVITPDGVEATVRWHTEQGGNPVLAAIAVEAIELLADPEERAKLRRCANPACSMLFLARTRRRVWCTDAICGNRARAARHYQRSRASKRGGTG